MKMNKTYLLLLPLTFYTCTGSALTFDSFFKTMDKEMKAVDEYFEKIHSEIHEARQTMANAWQQAAQQDKSAAPGSALSYSVEDEKDSATVIVTISSITTGSNEQPNINAKVEFNDNDNPVALVIITDHQTIRLDYDQQYQFLSVSVKREVREKQQDESGNASNRIIIGTARMSKTLTSNIQLDQPQIDYDKASQTLTVSINKVIEQKREKSISINIK